MKHRELPKPRLITSAALVVCTVSASQAFAEVPGRFYWKSLSGGSAVPLMVESISGNTNPFDPAHLVTPDGSFDATLAIAGYAQTFSLMDRASMLAILFPMGRIEGEASAIAGKSIQQSSSGFGDPTLEFNINLIGPKAQKNIPDAMRYEPGFSLDLIADLAMPIGQYDSDQALNIGQNRWYGRIGAPAIIQLGPWVPGNRTTLEFLPSVWMFGNNTDYVGQTLETDPLFQLDAHLTRDFTDGLWGSLDSSWYKGGKATINGIEGSDRNDLTFGLTLGYNVNHNLNLTASYRSTVNDNEPGDMSMDSFMLTLVYGWHPLIEGSKRLKAE